MGISLKTVSLLLLTKSLASCMAFSIRETNIVQPPPKSSSRTNNHHHHQVMHVFSKDAHQKDSFSSSASTAIEYWKMTGGTMWAAIFMTAASVFGSPQCADASLLEQFGTDPNSKDFTTKVAPSTPTSPKMASADTVQIDPTLRGSYYYPTAKKRYLPRIQKVTNELAQVPDAILNDDWESVRDFAKIAENAILPLQLYQSSLDGQGLSMSNNYAKIMKQDALEYEKQYKLFEKAIGKRDKDAALSSVTNMGVAVADYRQQGRLRDDDGNIPSVDEIKRMTMRKPTIQVNRPN